jgi:hypothetical protein
VRKKREDLERALQQLDQRRQRSGRNRAGVDELGHVDLETLGQTREQVEGDDEEGLVGLVDEATLGVELVIVVERLLDNLQAALVDRNGVGGERLGGSDGDGREALNDTKKNRSQAGGRR